MRNNRRDFIKKTSAFTAFTLAGIKASGSDLSDSEKSKKHQLKDEHRLRNRLMSGMPV